jgi:hypothetical protein
VQLSNKGELEQAHCVLFLAAQNSKGEWLLRKRLVHPAFGKAGFLHCEPMAGEDILVSAKRSLKRRANLTGEFAVRGSGFIKLFRNNELESFTQFTLLYAKDVQGDLASPGDSGHNFWYCGKFNDNNVDFFSNMSILMQKLQKSNDLFYVEISQEV